MYIFFKKNLSNVCYIYICIPWLMGWPCQKGGNLSLSFELFLFIYLYIVQLIIAAVNPSGWNTTVTCDVSPTTPYIYRVFFICKSLTSVFLLIITQFSKNQPFSLLQKMLCLVITLKYEVMVISYKNIR